MNNFNMLKKWMKQEIKLSFLISIKDIQLLMVLLIMANFLYYFANLQT